MIKNLLFKFDNKRILSFIFSRGGLILFLFLIVFSISACGIAIYYYLSPPIYLSPLSFYHASNNDSDIAVGYEYFYRIYDSENTNTSENTIISDANVFFTNNNLLDLLFSNNYLIEGSDFKRILPIWDDISTNYYLGSEPIPSVSPPVMTIDPAYFDSNDSSENFTITLNISTVSGTGKISTTSYFPSGSYKSEIDFERYVNTINDSNFYQKSFLDFNSDQDDVPVLSASDIDIAFFVVLYGRDENFVPIFSDVVYIGTQFNFN